MKAFIITITALAAIYSGVTYASGSAAKDKASTAISARAQAIEKAVDAAK